MKMISRISIVGKTGVPEPRERTPPEATVAESQHCRANDAANQIAVAKAE